MINSVWVDSDVTLGIKASRTKTTKIINEKIGPYVTKKIVSLVNTTFLSIIIDETTDVSTKKCLAILFIENQKVCDSFLRARGSTGFTPLG